MGEEYEVIAPKMPNKLNAKYLEWKIWFEKFIPHFELEVILVGHSLGGTFLVKYLSENKLPKKIRGVFLVAACYNTQDSDYSMADFILPKNLEGIYLQAGKIFIYHSKDDEVVPFADFEKYKKELPKAVAREFTDRGHFNQEEFPELFEDIRDC